MAFEKKHEKKACILPPFACFTRFEFWESNVAGRLGLGVALRYALSIGMQPIEERIRLVAASLRHRLNNERGVSVMDLGRAERQCGIVSFTVRGVDAGIVMEGLRSEGVYVSTSSAGSTPLDAADRALPDVVRERFFGHYSKINNINTTQVNASEKIRVAG